MSDSNLSLIRGRSTVLSLTNNSGATRSPGDLVILDTAASDSFTVSTSSNTTVPVGVVDELIGISSNGRVVVSGYARAVKTTGASVKGDYLYHSTTSATAATLAGSSPQPGAFGRVTTAGSGTSTTAYIFPTTPTIPATLSVASNSTDVTGSSGIGGATTTYSPGTHFHKGVASISHTSNTFVGAITLVAQGSVGITSPSSGTFAINAVGGASGGGGGAAANLASDRVLSTAGDVTTTSTTFVDLTSATITLTTGARRCFVTLTGFCFNSGNNNMFFDVVIDGVNQGGTWGLWGATQISGSADIHSANGSYLTAALSAASHTIKIQWRTDAGTATFRRSSTAPLHFAVVELYAE